MLALFYAGARFCGMAGANAPLLFDKIRALPAEKIVEVEDFVGRDDFIASLREGSVVGKLTGNYVHLLTRLDVMRKWWTRRRAKTGA